MSKSVSYCILIGWAVVVVVLSAVSPNVLSDNNAFLKNFINHEILNVLGVILAITIASAGQLHLTLNSIEEKHSAPNHFVKTRNGIRSASYGLVWLFFVELVIVVIKPLLCAEGWAQSIFNGASLMVVICSVLALVSIVQAVFAIKAT